MATTVDPICKMDVDTENPPGGQSEYEGTTYYFCAPGCKVAFDEEPRVYLSREKMASHDDQHDPGHDHALEDTATGTTCPKEKRRLRLLQVSQVSWHGYLGKNNQVSKKDTFMVGRGEKKA